MPQLPRIAIGSIPPNPDSEALTWGLLKLLADEGSQVQHFLSRACFSPHDGALAASGNSSRHLDSWLMSPSVCRETFLRGVREADFALVDGHFRTSASAAGESSDAAALDVGGSLETLCRWLDLPRLGVVDVSRLDHCCLPARPDSLDGILLDRYADDRQYLTWQTTLEALWGVPVLGGLAALPALRACIDRVPRGQAPSVKLCDELACHLTRHTDLPAIRRLAARRSLPAATCPATPCCASPTRIRIAMAYDEAFHCYFPDTLDQLEMLGATVIDFSPLRDECLPDNVDVVYFGCGHPERWTEPLAANQCMMMSIRNHLCSGRRLYAEGGGLAYLCQHIETSTGERAPMLGVLAATARLHSRPSPPRATELTLARCNWLAAAGTTLRGYLNSNWEIEPTGPLERYAQGTDQQLDLVGQYQAIGSRLHLNFAAQPDFLDRFVRPYPVGVSTTST